MRFKHSGCMATIFTFSNCPSTNSDSAHTLLNYKSPIQFHEDWPIAKQNEKLVASKPPHGRRKTGGQFNPSSNEALSSNAKYNMTVQQLAAAKEHHSQGDVAKAAALYDALLMVNPNDPEILSYSGLACLQLGNFYEAFVRLTLALKNSPDQPGLINLLGLALFELGRYEEACERFKEAIRVNPDYVDAYCNMGRTLLRQGRDMAAQNSLNKAIQLNPEHGTAFQLLATFYSGHAKLIFISNYYQRLAWYFLKQAPSSEWLRVRHTFFCSPQKAFDTARQGNRVQETSAASSQQICYYFGEPFPDAPANLIHMPLEYQAFAAFTLSSRLHLPTDVDFDPSVPEERSLANKIVKNYNAVDVERSNKFNELAEAYSRSMLQIVSGQPVRVFLGTSRLTNVMQYNSRDLAQAFRQQGCEVLFMIEANDRELLTQYNKAKAIAGFNPHITVNINEYNSGVLHPDVFNVTWWQDPMEEIKAGKPILWRQRDLIYSVDKEFDVYLYQCGAANVQRQRFCYDDNVFLDIGQERKSRVVVVASSYRESIARRPPEKLLAFLEEMFAAGEPLTDAQLEYLAGEYDYPKNDIYWGLWFYVVRDQSVRWLCSLSDAVDVEVYGRHWEEDDIVRPFFKGELPHGPAVASVYNAAQYVLVSHPFDLQSQRLMEAAACGALPVVYDCRYRAEKPHWDENFLWYRTKEDMRACLTKTPPKPPSDVCQGRTYTDFAKRILAEVSRQENARH